MEEKSLKFTVRLHGCAAQRNMDYIGNAMDVHMGAGIPVLGGVRNGKA